MIILGFSALYHDSAAVLCRDGEIIAAAQEERFTRKKHDKSLPFHAIEYCLRVGGGDLGLEDVDMVVYYDNPLLTLDRFIHNIYALGKEAEYLIGNSVPPLFGDRLWIHKNLRKRFGFIGKEDRLFVTEHHISHAASAFYPSPFESAAIITTDGVGEWATTTIGVGEGNRIKLLEEIDYPHSLGLLYSTFTSFCGFKVNSGDYKFMGLAPYGEPLYYDRIKENIITVKEDGSYRLNLDYFDFYKCEYMFNEKFEQLFGGAARKPESKITRREMDIAASVQRVTEEIIIKMARHAKEVTKKDNLVLAGGVALNCVANGKLLKEKLFDSIWIQPAAGDAGGALGCALYAGYTKGGLKRIVNPADSQKGSYLGPCFTNAEIKEFLDNGHCAYHFFDNKDRLYETIAEELAGDKVIGWFSGRMEYGPRALGNRSIIADPRSEKMQSKLNLKIKYRESFRPFAPSVLEERAADYFELEERSPYMLLVANVKEDRRIPFDKETMLGEYDNNMLPIVNSRRSDIPAVTHIDYSARIQTVNKEDNEAYYSLIKKFEELTGCGLVVNTSFNVRGEPIVCTPEEAYRCFMRTEMDILVLENFVLYKEEQSDLEDKGDWRKEYELD